MRGGVGLRPDADAPVSKPQVQARRKAARTECDSEAQLPYRVPDQQGQQGQDGPGDHSAFHADLSSAGLCEYSPLDRQCRPAGKSLRER
jgi:hypothetical protein